MAELINLNRQSASRLLRQVCALPAVCTRPQHTRVLTRASAHPFHVGRLWSDSFDGGSSRCVVATCGPSVAVVALAVRLELAGMCCASHLHASSRVVLAAMVWLPQQLIMSSRAAAVTGTYGLRDPMDRTE